MGTVFVLSGVLLFASIWPTGSSAQWAPGGIPVPGAGQGANQAFCSDGSGGFYLGWDDTRTYATTSDDVFAQHMTGDGFLANGFPATGVPVCTDSAGQYFGSIAPDGSGGALLAWLDGRGPVLGWDFYASRLLASGAVAPGWGTNGTPLVLTSGSSDNPAVVADGAGGGFFIWEDERSDVSDLYAQHLLADGSIAPGWAANGLPVVVMPGAQGHPWAVSDGAGGILISWDDGRPAALGVYMQHMLGTGSLAPGWPVNGRFVSARGRLQMVPDQLGGFYMSSSDAVGVPFGTVSDFYIQRITASGQTSPGWPADGVVVCNAPNYRTNSGIASDNAGRVFMAWTDYRGGGSTRVYGTCLQPDGTFAPGWQLNGTTMSTYPGNQFFASLVADEYGGCYLGYQFDSSGGSYALVQHFGGNGQPAPGWNADGVLLSGGDTPELLADGAGGATVIWNKYGAGVWAQRFVTDGPVATLISLVSADAGPDRVSLLWQSASAQGLVATVDRRTETSAWLALGAPTLQAPDRLSFVDQTVVAGTRYAYRLGYVDGGAEQFTAETWVDVPKLAVFALEGARPNPAVRTLNVSLSLRDESPATLSVLDVAGRAVLSREVGSLGAGRHTVALDLGANAAPGVYWLRLTQSGHALLARAAMIR